MAIINKMAQKYFSQQLYLTSFYKTWEKKKIYTHIDIYFKYKILKLNT